MAPVIRTEHAREDAIAARRQECLTVKEYAAFVGQHPQSVYRRIAKGTQPGVVRAGGEILIDVAQAIVRSKGV